MDLDPVIQEFIAEVGPYLRGIEEMKAETATLAGAMDMAREHIAEMEQAIQAWARVQAHLDPTLVTTEQLLKGQDQAANQIRVSLLETANAAMVMGDEVKGSVGPLSAYMLKTRDATRGATFAFFGMRIGVANALHWLVMGSLEILSTVIPAITLLGAALGAMMPTFIHISDQMNFLRIATGSWKQAMLDSVGPLHNLAAGMGNLSNAVRPDAYIIFGAIINSIANQFQKFTPVVKQAAGVLADFATKLSNELAGGLGRQLGNFFSNALQLMIQWGQVLGNLAHIFVNVMTSMWGVGKLVLSVLDVITRALVAFTNTDFGKIVIGFLAAYSALYRFATLLLMIARFAGFDFLIAKISVVTTTLIDMVPVLLSVRNAEDAVAAGELLMEAAAGPVIAAMALIAAGLGVWWLLTRHTGTATDALIQRVQKMPKDLNSLEHGMHMLTDGYLQQAKAARTVTEATNAGRYAYLQMQQAQQTAIANGAKLIAAMKKQAQEIINLVTGLAQAGQRTGQVGAAMNALAIQTAIADSKVQQMNQAIDQYLGLVTGGTAAVAAFNESIFNLGSVVANSGSTLSRFNGTLNITADRFSKTLNLSTAKGAQAWQNFDQVVGQTAPAVLDWFRQLGVVGASTGADVYHATLDMAAAMVKFAGSNVTARAQVLAFVRAQGINVRNWHDLTAAIRRNGAGQADLTKRTDAATQAMAHLSQMAKNAANALNTQVSTSISQAALKSSGFNDALSQLQTDMANRAPASVIHADMVRVQGDLSIAKQRAIEMGNGINSAANQSQAATGRIVAGANNARAAFDRLKASADNAASAIRSIPRNWYFTLHVNQVGTISVGPGGGGISHINPGLSGHVTSGAAGLVRLPSSGTAAFVTGGNMSIHVHGSVHSEQSLATAVQTALLGKAFTAPTAGLTWPGRRR